MIGILRPQPSPGGSSGEKDAYIKEKKYVAPQRYDGVGQLASLAAPQDPDNGGFLAAESPPRPLGAAELERYRSNADKTDGQLAVTTIQSAGDVHEIKELNNSAEIGALCVAVVRQSSKQASRQIWSTTRGGAAVANQSKSMLFGGPPGVSAGRALRVLLRRYVQVFAPRGSAGAQNKYYSEACLVLYCKLAGGVIMASPLDGAAFRLRPQLPVVEDGEAPAREATETHLTCWTLPSAGFEALLDLKNSLVPGLPTLARDMANDKRLADNVGCGLTPLAEEISAQLCDGDESRKQHVVVPRVAGIIFASLGPAPASTMSLPRGSTGVGGGGGGRSGASLRVTTVLARLEQEDGTVVHRFVLEDFELFGDGGAGEGSPRKGRITKRTSTKGRTRRVSLPTTYAALLEEATSPRPSPGPSIATKILRRWRRGHKYRAGVNQVVPGVGEVTAVLAKEHHTSFLGMRQSARCENVATAPGEIDGKKHAPAETPKRVGKVKQSAQSENLREHLLSVGDVMSASSSQAAFWASTRDVIWAMLAAACREGGDSCTTAETQRSTAAESTGASCTAARRATCALLARVFGNVTAGEAEETGQSFAGIGRKEASTALDWWYERFCAATAPPYGGGGVGGGTSFLLQEKAPRLLLEDMLEIPALKVAFVKRGLTRHLTDALRAGSLEMQAREVSICRHYAHIRQAPDRETPSCGMSELPKNAPARATKTRGRIRARNCSAGRKANLPWWLLFSRGRGERGAGGHVRGFSETLKKLGGSTDGAAAEADGRSCQTALDEIFASERGKAERGAETSREDDPNDGNSIGSTVGLPASATAKQRDCRELAEAVGGGAGVGGGSKPTKTGRVAPPLLRLDALGSILDTEEGASARFYSSQAVASLSAASTRAASDHLPTLLSARGATSRASARHGSGRSARTGRTTQRDSTASTGCPTVRSTSPSAPADLEVAAADPPPLLSPPPSWRYSDGEPVRCCENRDEGAGSCRGAVVMEPWTVPDVKATASNTISPAAAAAKAPGGSSRECIVVDGGGVLLAGGDRTAEVASAVPARQGEGGGSSGREGMPRLHLEGLPVNEAGWVTNVEGAAGGSIDGDPSPPAATIGQRYLNKSAALAHPSRGGNSALRIPPEAGHEPAARPDRSRAVNRGSLQPTDGSSAGYVRRSAKRATPEGDVSGILGCRFDDAPQGAAPEAGDNDGLRCWAPRDTTPTTFVLDFARSSAHGLASCSSPSQPQQEPASISDVFGAEIAVATLLTSLLPSTPVKHHPEESLLVALDVLSFVGTLSWIDGAETRAAAKTATTTFGSTPTKGPTSSHPSTVPEALREPRPAEVWPSELDNVGIALLANTAGAHLGLRLTALESLFEEGRQDDRGEEISSDKHRRRVHNACRLVLESTWLTRLILRRVVATGALDERLRPALSGKTAGDAMRFCASSLGVLQRGMRATFSRPPFVVASTSGPTIGDEGAPEESPEVFLEHGGCSAEMLLLTAPVIADLTALLIVLVRRPMAWGEDPAWAARTLGSTALCRDDGDSDEPIIPVLIELLGQLVEVAAGKEGDPQQRVGSGVDQLDRLPRAHRSLPETAETLEKRLTGDRAVLDHLLVAVLDSFVTILRRAKILLEMSEDASRGVLGSAATAAAVETPAPAAPAPAETGRVSKAPAETSEAVSRVARGTERAFQPGGPILTILETQLPPISPHSEGTLLCGDANSDTPVTAFRKSPPAGSAIPIPCVAVALRLSIVFFSLCGTAGVRDEAGFARLEDFVGPLFSGFRVRWESGFVGDRGPDVIHAVPPAEHGRRGVGCEARHEPKAERGKPIRRSESEGGISLCRLNLEALVELAATRDPAVLRRLDECRVAPFLLRRVLAISDGTGGRLQEPLGLLNAAQGCEKGQLSLGNGQGLSSTPAPRRTQVGNATHGGGSGGSGGSGGGDTLRERAKPLGSAAAGRVLLSAGASLSVGDRVEGLVSVKSGRPRWFPGRVERVNGNDGTVHVCYDDGDEEPNKDSGEVRPSRRGSTERAQRRLLRPDVQQLYGGEETPATAAPATPSAATIVRQGGKQRTGTTDDTTSRPGLSLAADGAVAAVKGAGQQATVETSAVAAVSAGNSRDLEPAVSSAGGSGNSAENDSEDDDAYFVIPSVVDAAAAASSSSSSTNIRPFSATDSSSPISVVPKIDLQSPVFRTRVFSSQLGPGSSLSTPTTGGGRVLDALRGAGESRSETPSSTPAFPSRRSSQAQRPPSFIARSLRGSGVTRSASVLSDADPSPVNPRGLERQIARLLSCERETSSSEEEAEEDDDEEDDLGSYTSGPVARCPTRQVSRGPGDAETGRGHAATAATAPGVPAGAAKTLLDEKPSSLRDDVGADAIARRESDDVRVIKGLAVTLLLSMAATSNNVASPRWGHSSPPAPLERSGAKQETAEVAQVMSLLQEFFEDDRNVGIVPSLTVRWRSRVMSTAESAPAVLAKLVCAALFDSQSYPLDGDHISAGRFGGIIVSKCPLGLGGARLHRASVQARGGTSSLGRREESATLPPLASSSPSDSQQEAEATDGDADEVALKVVERDGLDSATGANVFTEVLALRTLADVPGVCYLYDFGVTPASYILVIERCVGSLKEWRLARSAGDESGGGGGDGASPGAPRSDEEAALYLLVFRQVASTVAAMAERGVIHFDLKCENILVRRSSASEPALVPPAVLNGGPCAEHDVAPPVCVADFGESIVGRGRRRRRRTTVADAGESSSEHPASDPATDDDFLFDVRGARGTERIQSPEMVRLSGGGGRLARPGSGSAGAREETEGAADRITPASDVWSLGCLLYELLSNQLLFGDLQWSEFFVTLTTGGEVIGPTGDDMGVPTPAPPLPPPRSLRPFAALGCVEALRQLLAAMLVRNPAKRPSASQTVRLVDEALAAITSSISKKRSQGSPGSDLLTTIVGERPSTYPPKVDERASASAHANVSGNTGGRSAKPGENGAEMAGTETLSRGAISFTGPEHAGVSNEEENQLTITTLAPTATSAPLRPCMAVVAHRKLDAERSALLGCDGCLHRLGAGAFILTGPTGGSSTKGNQIYALANTPDQDLSAWPQVGPATKVWCSAADCDDFTLRGDMQPGMSEEAEVSRNSLGSVLPLLGISHVVCVLPKRADATSTRCCSAATKQSASCEPQPQVSQMAEGTRLLRVFVSLEEDSAEEGEEKGNEPDSTLSGPHGMTGVVRDVLRFATGPRVLFVGGGGGRSGDVAGALAMVWAMARTGKGSYETMLDFRQTCAGFYVDSAILKSVLQ